MRNLVSGNVAIMDSTANNRLVVVADTKWETASVHMDLDIPNHVWENCSDDMLLAYAEQAYKENPTPSTICNDEGEEVPWVLHLVDRGEDGWAALEADHDGMDIEEDTRHGVLLAIAEDGLSSM